MRKSSSTQCLRSAMAPTALHSVVAALPSSTSSARSPATGIVGLTRRGAVTSFNAQRSVGHTLAPFPRSPLHLCECGTTIHATTSMRTFLGTATAAGRLHSAIFALPHTHAVRCASDDATTHNHNNSNNVAANEKSNSEKAVQMANEGTPAASSDPMSTTANPRYTSHTEAERIAYLQEDNVQHRDFNLQGSGGDCCSRDEVDGCGHAPWTEMEARRPRLSPLPSRVSRDFGTVFHQEIAAWRASQRHSQHHADAHCGGDGGGATQGTTFEASLTPAADKDLPSHHPPHHPSRLHAHLADVPTGLSDEATVEHLKAEEEMQRFLAQNTIHSIRRSMHRENAAAAAEAVLTSSSTMRTRLEPHHGYRGVQALLDYNKQWAAEVSRFNPRYFLELAKEQKPEYLWIGCSDSRVPANEVIGLHPGDVFVHRNIGNIFSLSDLNCLSALQFAVDCLKVQHVIVAGHYKCGGVTAAMRGDHLGLTDHWIMQVADIKNRWWDRVMADIAEEYHLNVLCELNVLEQLSHVVNCRIVQRRWKAQNANDRYYGRTTSSVYVRPAYAADHFSDRKLRSILPTTVVNYEEELEVHGWVYSLDDGMLRPLLSLTRHSNVKKEIAEAIEALFIRYSQMM